MPKPAPPLLTSREAAERLGVNPSTIWRWVESGRLVPLVELSNGYHLFDPNQIDALAKKGGIRRWHRR